VDQQQQSRWRPSIKQILLAAGIVIVLVVLIRIGYAYQWTGFRQSKVSQDVQPAKTLWDWLDLLIVPAVLAGGVAWLNWAQRQRERDAEKAQQERADKAEEDRRRREREAQAAQRERELEVENQRAQDTALQAYLDKMDDMLTRLRYEIGSASTEELSGSGATDSGDRKAPVRIRDLRTLIRARTLTVLERLDGVRKRAVMRFLLELRLIDGEVGTASGYTTSTSNVLT
jgi:hypothetical protein